jgi:hypothetical protein
MRSWTRAPSTFSALPREACTGHGSSIVLEEIERLQAIDLPDEPERVVADLSAAW